MQLYRLTTSKENEENQYEDFHAKTQAKRYGKELETFQSLYSPGCLHEVGAFAVD
ncbi:hypothetical protein GHT06_014008 [Daphnia sinensis]|uniref:Uncharacterized protein n=1 Tax=Daphnia sinensis TaxID=1820382 RepID=A0AAD5LDM8_9CRUS|nr:hypothetical protein GHT06_014008 [Daphnia sinensis]